MNLHSTRPLLLRPLARGLLLALASLSAGAALAGDLDGQNAEVVAGDTVESWTLKNGSTLIGRDAAMNEISAEDTSTITLEGGTVTSMSRSGAATLAGNATLTAVGTHFRGGGIGLNGGDTVARLTGGSIIVAAADLTPQSLAVGVDLRSAASGSGNRNPLAVLDAMQIRVEDNPGTAAPYNSGLGVRLQFGTMDILNGSHVTGANVGAMLWGELNPAGAVTLNVDDSTLVSQRSAAIQVMPLEDNDYNITIRNDAKLSGADGNLLLVRSEFGPLAARTDVNFTVDDSRLAGNVTFDPTTVTNGTLDVILRNKAQIDGRFINVTTASIDSDATWLMTGDSNVGHLTLGAGGTVALGNGSSFNTLSLDEFTGNGGTLLFNTQLGDDTSLTDKLVIAGDANGQANVRRWVDDLLPLLTDEDPLDVEGLATHHLPLADAPDAYATFQKKGDGAIKMVFNP